MTATQFPRVSATPTVCSEPYSVRARTVASALPPGRCAQDDRIGPGRSREERLGRVDFGLRNRARRRDERDDERDEEGPHSTEIGGDPPIWITRSRDAGAGPAAEAPIVPTMVGRARAALASRRRRLRVLARRLRGRRGRARRPRRHLPRPLPRPPTSSPAGSRTSRSPTARRPSCTSASSRAARSPRGSSSRRRPRSAASGSRSGARRSRPRSSRR